MKKNLAKYIPFGIAGLLTLQYLIKVFFSSDIVSANGDVSSVSVLDSVIFATVGLVITLILIIIKNEFWKYSFLTLTILSLTPWVRFFDYSFSFGIKPISIELIALGLLIGHLVLNPEMLAILSKMTKPTEENIKEIEDKKANHFENRVKDFEQKFRKKTKKELEQIVAENELIPEAVEAAKRILR